MSIVSVPGIYCFEDIYIEQGAGAFGLRKVSAGAVCRTEFYWGGRVRAGLYIVGGGRETRDARCAKVEGGMGKVNKGEKAGKWGEVEWGGSRSGGDITRGVNIRAVKYTT